MLTQFIATAERGIVAAIILAAVLLALFVAWSFAHHG